MHDSQITAATPVRAQSRLERLEAERERIHARLVDLPAGSHKAIELRAHLSALVMEILAYEPRYRSSRA
jgi:hypothetical protein